MKVENILMVDDDNEDSEFFTMVVKEIDPEINVRIATSKEELFNHLKQFTPDLLFIDSFIQHDSGVASIYEIRNDSNWFDLPVIMYTGAADKFNISKAFDAGASAYIVKPSTMAEIRKILHFVLNKNWKEPDLPKEVYKDNRFTTFHLNDKDSPASQGS